MRRHSIKILTLVLVLAFAAAALAAKSEVKAKPKKTTAAETTKSPVTATPIPLPANSTTTGSAANVEPGSITNDGATLPNSVATQTPSAPQAGEQINWDVIASGGGPMSSANFRLDGTLGQTVAGPSTSANFALNSGYWQNFGAAYLCGDVDDNGRVDIGDAVFLVNYIFAGGPAPDPAASGDNDCNDRIDIADAVFLINYIFAGGAAPCAACP